MSFWNQAVEFLFGKGPSATKSDDKQKYIVKNDTGRFNASRHTETTSLNTRSLNSTPRRSLTPDRVGNGSSSTSSNDRYLSNSSTSNKRKIDLTQQAFIDLTQQDLDDTKEFNSDQFVEEASQSAKNLNNSKRDTSRSLTPERKRNVSSSTSNYSRNPHTNGNSEPCFVIHGNSNVIHMNSYANSQSDAPDANRSSAQYIGSNGNVSESSGKEKKKGIVSSILKTTLNGTIVVLKGTLNLVGVAGRFIMQHYIISGLVAVGAVSYLRGGKSDTGGTLGQTVKDIEKDIEAVSKEVTDNNTAQVVNFIFNKSGHATESIKRINEAIFKAATDGNLSDLEYYAKYHPGPVGWFTLNNEKNCSKLVFSEQLSKVYDSCKFLLENSKKG